MPRDISDVTFLVWFDGGEWSVSVGGSIVGYGSTPVTAMMQAEAWARKNG